MILQMKNEDLIKGLSPLVLLAKSNTRHQLPIFSHIRIETTFTHVIFNAADGARFLSVMVENPNGNVGVCTVHAKSLFDLLETFHIGSVTKLELISPEKLVVKNGRSKFNLSSSDPAMFPLFQVPNDGYATVHPQSLLDAFSIVDASIASDETRPSLECIFFGPSGEEGFMRAVASDGHKLTSCKVPGVLPSNFLLHKDNLVMLRALFKGQEECEIYLTENVLLFRGATWAYQTRLLDVKKFPNFETIFETKTPITVELNVLEFKAAVDRCLMFAGDRQHVVVDCKADIVEVTANSEGGSGVEEVAVLLSDALPSEFRFGVNGEYLSMLLKRFETKKVTLKMSSPLKPVLLTENTNFVSLLMPCKI
jgi:DNA polymerase III sliding clamp (beta) subunit (PCNA family)